MNDTVTCPVKDDEITGDDCILVCDVADGMIKPTCLPEGIEWNEHKRMLCRSCRYHADLDESAISEPFPSA